MASTFVGRSPSPTGLLKLILGNAPASMALWEKNYNNYRLNFPAEVQMALKEGEEKGDWEGEVYDAALKQFLKKHCCTGEWPEEWHRSFEWAAKDGTVVMAM